MTEADYIHNQNSLKLDISNKSREFSESFLRKLLGPDYKEFLSKYFEVIQNEDCLILVKKDA